ncbi:VOC family protein [Kocuria marina]|uniref:VOC family protein n=1 Tax=Kocuria marina TaxID=223184 RepID=UPI0022E62937|nr:VOC family protein [Kocuria marina]
MQKIIPHVWCQGTAEEAVAFYRDALPDCTLAGSSRYPSEGLPDFQQKFAGELLTADLRIGDYHVVLINAGEEYHPNPALSFFLNFDPSRDPAARASLQATSDRLGEGGTALMPLGEYPFSPFYGWVQDRFGVSWQLILSNPDGAPRPFVVPALMFCGPVQNRAREALDVYAATFDDAAQGTVVPYPEPTGPAPAGAVMFSDFSIAGEWFAAMDSGVEQPFTFDPGVSLAVQCRDQEEIDRLWSALSHHPEAEACGWCRDQFGVSWQIIPQGMGELMQHPGAHQRLLEMKKLSIAGLRGD